MTPAGFRGFSPLAFLRGLKSRQQGGGLSEPSAEADGNRKNLPVTLPTLSGYSPTDLFYRWLQPTVGDTSRVPGLQPPCFSSGTKVPAGRWVLSEPSAEADGNRKK